MIPRITPRVLHLHHCTRVYMIPRITPRVLLFHHCTRVYLIQCWYPPHMYSHLMTRFTGAYCRIVRRCSFCSDINTDSHWVLCPFHGGGGSASRGVLHPGVCIQGGLHPPPIGYYGIWSTSGQYASHWNAFLFSIVPIPFPGLVPCSVSEPLVSDLVLGSVSVLSLISLWSNECHTT